MEQCLVQIVDTEVLARKDRLHRHPRREIAMGWITGPERMDAEHWECARRAEILLAPWVHARCAATTSAKSAAAQVLRGTVCINLVAVV